MRSGSRGWGRGFVRVLVFYVSMHCVFGSVGCSSLVRVFGVRNRVVVLPGFVVSVGRRVIVRWVGGGFFDHLSLL